MNKDKIVSNIYETYDYEKFKTLPENRGQKFTKKSKVGLKPGKVQTLQRLVDSGQWIDEIALVYVNKDFEIINGAHTKELCERNKFPIRYMIIDHESFNEVAKRELVGSIYSINQVNTSWSARELFNAAVQTKAPVAIVMEEIIVKYENYFLWTDLMALLLKDSELFMGKWRKLSMKHFEDKDLLNEIKSEAFAAEVKHFTKINLKSRIARRKGLVLKAAYDVIWHARDLVDPMSFRKALAMIPENLIESTNRYQSEESIWRMLVQHFNKSQGKSVETSAVIFQLRNRNGIGNGQPIIQL